MLDRGVRRLACEIQSGKISALEVIQAHLKRIETTHSSINAVVAVLRDSALAEAVAVDRRRQLGEPFRPLEGIPFSIKDSIDVARIRTTSGTLGRRDSPPATKDAVLVSRLRQAGAIPIAKTNLPDLLYSFETNNFIFGRTNNPYDFTRTSGGSSGGEAALLAIGGSSLGLGSDAFGSVRLPAAFCGIAAIKPTNGRLPRTGHVPGPGGWVEGLWQIGPMARQVRDLALVMRLLAYADDEDLWSPPVPLMESTRAIRDLRVAFYTHNGFSECRPEIVAAVQKCAAFLAELGAQVTEDRAPGVADAFDLEMKLFGADGCAAIDGYLAERSQPAHPLQTHFLSYMRPHQANGAEFAKLWEQWDQYRRDMLRFFARYDIVLSPIYTQTALKHDDSLRDENFRGFSYTMAWNMAQAPAVSVCCDWVHGLPVSVQVVAKPWSDMLALQVAEAIEERFEGSKPCLDDF